MITGLEVVLADRLPELVGRRAGLITNHTGLDRRLHRNVDLLCASGWIEVVTLFSPEHGLWGEIQAGVWVGEQVDGRTGLPVYSLYGETEKPTAEMLDGLDLLIFDIQDLGVRFATRLSIMVGAQVAAAAAGMAFVILDRPNPLAGEQVEGGLLDPRFASLVGCHPIPIRHGMTLGELGRLVAGERGWPEPIVVAMEGWRRGAWFDETGLPWVPPSPNLPTLDSLTVYPGSCLLEGTNLSEGRGTTRPFEYVGAPWLDPFALAKGMQERALPGVAFRPAYFTPTFAKHAGVVCGGVQIHIQDRDAMRPVALGVHLIEVARDLDPAAFAWRSDAAGRYPLDRLLGSDRPRRAFDAGATATTVMATWADEAREFADRRRPYLLY